MQFITNSKDPLVVQWDDLLLFYIIVDGSHLGCGLLVQQKHIWRNQRRNPELWEFAKTIDLIENLFD